MRKIAATRPLQAVIQIISCFCCHVGQISYKMLVWMWRSNCLHLTCQRHSERNERLKASRGNDWAHASRHVINTLYWYISGLPTRSSYKLHTSLLIWTMRCCVSYTAVMEDSYRCHGKPDETWPHTEGINKRRAARMARACSCTSAKGLFR